MHLNILNGSSSFDAQTMSCTETPAERGLIPNLDDLTHFRRILSDVDNPLSACSEWAK